MNIRRALKSFTMRFSRQGGYTAFMPAGATADYKREVGDGTSASVVMAPLWWMVRTFPEAPIMVEKQAGEQWEEIPGHDMTRLLHRPNPYWSGELMWMATILSLITTGDGYWIKVRGGQLRIDELWWVPSSIMEPKWPSSGLEFISHYEYRPGGTPIRVDVEDVVHFRYGVDPNNPRKGLSPLASLLREVFSDQEAASYAAALLKNMGVPGLIVAPDGDVTISDEDMEATKEALTNRFTGRNRGKPFVAGAPTKVTQFGFSPEQMDLRTLRRLPEERVTAVLGVPAIVAGLGAGLDRSTFANMSEAREMAYETTIIPLQRIIAADLGNQMLDDFEPNPDLFRVAFDLSEVRVLQEDENKQVERKLRELNGGAITLGEYRRETGREAGPEHDVYLRPFSVVEVPADQLGVPADPPSSSGGGDAQPPADDALPESNGSKARGRKATRVQQELMKQMRDRETALAGPFTAELIEMFLDLGKACGDVMETAGLRSRWAETKDTADDAADRIIVDRIMADVDVDGWQGKNLKPAFEKHYGRVITDTLETINGVTDLNVNLPDVAAREVIKRGGTRAGLVDVKNSTRNAIFRALRESRELGEGPAAAARRIRDYVPAGRFTNAGPQYRSQLIARTETKYAQNVSAIEAYKQSPAVSGLLAFDSQGGGETDDECMSRDGVTFTFQDADVELSREHPNGTLSFAPVI